MITDPIGLYVHIPYCIKKCGYCDFCSLPTSAGCVSNLYIDRLVREINEYRSFGETAVSTVYFGGGTPSLLQPEQLSKIVSALKDVFDFGKDIEFTVEANPGTVSLDKLFSYKEIGVNRISIGVQSFDDGELKALGRIHNKTDAIRAYNTVRDAGFDNVSIDLMYGIPNQTRESFLSTLEEAVSLSPEHISVYGLILEEGTPLYNNRDSLILPNEDEECDMYYTASELLKSHGYIHYEISNYAKDTRESKHNLKYWQAREYIGLGAAAASYFLGRRYSNTDSVCEYMNGCGIGYYSVEEQTLDDASFEYAMMHLRLRDGFSLEDYRSRFGCDFQEGREEILGRFKELSLLDISEGRIKLTERGFYVSNSILAELI